MFRSSVEALGNARIDPYLSGICSRLRSNLKGERRKLLLGEAHGQFPPVFIKSPKNYLSCFESIHDLYIRSLRSSRLTDRHNATNQSLTRNSNRAGSSSQRADDVGGLSLLSAFSNRCGVNRR